MFKQLHGRLQSILQVSAVFLVVNLLSRLVLLTYDGIEHGISLTSLPGIFAAGLVYDVAALAYGLVPFLLLAIVITNGRWGRKIYITLASLLGIAMTTALLFVLVSEFLFWNEFSSRFNFIAVDYLIYTREVLGNIRESYPVGWVFGGIGLIALVTIYLLRHHWWQAVTDTAALGKTRLVMLLALVVLPVGSYALVGDGLRESLRDNTSRELAANGYYEFLRAFRNNDLDYPTFYRIMPAQLAETLLEDEFEEGTGVRLTTAQRPDHVFPHVITGHGHEQHLNVVLVSIESLGSDYVEYFGGRRGLTPNLDRIAAQGLTMSQTYATGLRTVRGLEALTLSVPPTPGHAVLMRKNNKGMHTLGGVFKGKGYDTLYIYGGYSYFDNMNDFFSGNGYEVIDRTAIDEKNITHENIWGVADEDLYRQALREIDTRIAKGRKVFAHIMTTSNHRPYTFPEGRIDMPSGSGRDAAVKYTDWAIGNFIKEASTHTWFRDTVFVFIADHTSHGRGRTDLPPEHYRIPLIFYSPAHIKPHKVDYLMSQIDVAPILLGLLDFSYKSYFFGEDMLAEKGRHQRALMANYLTVGYMQDGMVVELLPKQRARVLDAATAKLIPRDNKHAQHLIDEAVAYYQVASDVLHNIPARNN